MAFRGLLRPDEMDSSYELDLISSDDEVCIEDVPDQRLGCRSPSDRIEKKSLIDDDDLLED